MEMAGSNDPVRAIAEILRRHVDRATLHKIANDLLEVRASKNFRETIEKLANELSSKWLRAVVERTERPLRLCTFAGLLVGLAPALADRARSARNGNSA